MKFLSEDKVRDLARDILELEDTETAKAGVGQLTSFKQLGFEGVADRPDGWYLPTNNSFTAIILEAKNSKSKFSAAEREELLKNCRIAATKYKQVIGILYNGYEVAVYKDGVEIPDQTELKNKEYYFGLFAENTIDKYRIFIHTKRINNLLHYDFQIKNLYHRMIFTACALVAKRYGALLTSGMTFNTFRNSIMDTLSKSYQEDFEQNKKLHILLDVFSDIKLNKIPDQTHIDSFIENVSAISDCINSDFWNGEDVMAIFFNEFNRYKKKSEQGQVFTPDHITSFMYHILDVTKDDIILDAACGSGAFLVKSMCNMIKEAGGVRTKKAQNIRRTQLYGIELDREIYALACANMLIHKDGKTNLELLDSRKEEAAQWISSKPITKVLMNPPFENKYGCLEIVSNVLDSVPKNTSCAFILPDFKLEKRKNGLTRRILRKHRLEKIIKLPLKTFSGTNTSIFVFLSGTPQNGREIFGCYISDDGLETVKNQGRQDVKGSWAEIEKEWVSIIKKQSGHDSIQWINPEVSVSYRVPEPPFTISDADLKKAVLDLVMFENNVSSKDFEEAVFAFVAYNSRINLHDESISITNINDQA